jgi:hypothetical protein
MGWLKNNELANVSKSLWPKGSSSEENHEIACQNGWDRNLTFQKTSENWYRLIIPAECTPYVNTLASVQSVRAFSASPGNRPTDHELSKRARCVSCNYRYQTSPIVVVKTFTLFCLALYPVLRLMFFRSVVSRNPIQTERRRSLGVRS